MSSRVGSASSINRRGRGLAHAVQIPITIANQWISQAPVRSLLVQAKANNKRVSKTSRKTTEISEPLLTTQHGRETPMPPLGLSRAFRGRLPCLSSELLSTRRRTVSRAGDAFRKGELKRISRADDWQSQLVEPGQPTNPETHWCDK